MLPNKKYEDMERYINLEMTDEERTTFELEIAESDELAKAVALYKDIPNQLQQISDDLDFNKKLQAARSKFKTPTHSKTNPFLWALGIILVATVGYLGYQQIKPTVPIDDGQEQEEKTPEEFKIPEGVPIAGYLWNNKTEKPSSLITRSGDIISDDEQKYEDAFLKYTAKDYESTINLLNTITDDSEVYKEALVLKGTSQFDAGNITDAIATFDIYLANDSFTKDKVLWYQALAYLQNDQNDAAKKNLQAIIDEDYSKAGWAKSIIKELDQKNTCAVEYKTNGEFQD